MLSLPYVFKMTGLILGSILIVLGSLTCLWTLGMLVSTVRRLKAPRNYMAICIQVGGKPLGLVLESSIIIFVFGVIIVYQLITFEILNTFLTDLGASKELLEDSWAIALHKIITAIFILFPLCCIRDISSLSYASLLSILTLGYTILVIIIECPWYFNQNYERLGIDYFIIDMNIYDAFTFVFYAYTYHFAFFNIYQELKRPSKRRITKVYIYIYIYT